MSQVGVALVAHSPIEPEKKGLRMSAYFRSWPRRMGVITLIFACMLLGGWLRSRSYTDAIWFSLYGCRVAVVSSCSKIRLLDHHQTPLTLLQRGDEGVQAQRILFGSERFNAQSIDFPTKNMQIVSASYLIDGSLQKISLIPYWTIVLPLTLLSAVLLLPRWRTRSRTVVSA
jgi:hypothetical protein